MSKTLSTTADTPTEDSYTVLYYKRKNKVHKSKGVSKMDGVLTILPPPKSFVTLKDDGQIIFRGIQKEIAKQEFEVDDCIVLGAYEVEILSHDTASTTSASMPTMTSSIVSKPQHVSRKPIAKYTGPLHPTRRSRPLLGSPTRILTTIKQKPAYKRPPQPKLASNKNETFALSDNDDNSSDDDGNDFVHKENNGKLLPRKRPLSLTKQTTRAPVLKKIKQACRLSPIPSNRTAFAPYPKRPTQMAGATSSPQTFFPGAIGPIDVPHAIKSVLNPHQIEGVTFLWNCLNGNGTAATVSPHTSDSTIYNGAILADEMGLGKTLMTIAAICAMHRHKRGMRFVVVCPSSLVVNWAKEFDKWLGKASQPKRVVIKKGGEEGLNQIKAFCAVKPNQAEVLIISYDLFRMHSSRFQQIKKVSLLVADEGHRLKNTNGSLTLNALESLPCDARLCITATPIQNILSDFFNIANFVCPGLLGDLATFRREYERPISASNNKSCSSKQKSCGLAQSRTLDEIIRTFMLRRLQKDVLKSMLPPRHEVLLFCRPTTAQRKMYKKLTTAQQGTGLSKGGATADALTTLIKLRKLCSHPALLENDVLSAGAERVDIALSSKLTLLDSLLVQTREKAPGDKVVIVSNFTSALSMIENSILKPRDLSYLRLDGTTDISNRQALVDTFNRTSSERSFVFLLSSKAGGCGLNLIGANRLVMFDPDWNPASDIQAMARVYRQGQKKPCTIYRLFTSGTVEEVICQRQIQKGNLATLTVDGTIPTSNGTATGFTKEELRDCFTLKEGCDCDTKIKVGDHWPSYDGAESIEDQGCEDQPLLAVASNDSTSLAFVHVVNQEVEKVHVVSKPTDSFNNYSSGSSEDEFQSDPEEASDGGLNKELESSDEEAEF